MQRDWEKQRRRLLSLPGKLGFASVKDLISALGLVNQTGRATRSKTVLRPHRKARRIVTEALRQKVRALVTEGRTLREISKITDLSPASVQNIKNAFGLSKKRKP